MNKRAQFFVGLTIASGVCLVAYCLAEEAVVVPSSAYLVAVLLALLASTLKVHLPGITGTISVNFLLILIAVAVFSFAETVLLASLACILQCLWRPRSRPRIVQVSFNVATLAISSGASYRISHVFAGSSAEHLALLMALAAWVYFVADTLLVSGVLSLVISLLPVRRGGRGTRGRNLPVGRVVHVASDSTRDVPCICVLPDLCRAGGSRIDRACAAIMG